MAGVNLIYSEGTFAWSYTPGSIPATELRLKWGTASGQYGHVKAYGPTTTGDAVANVLPAGSTGQFYARMVAANARGEGVASAEVPFVVSDGRPNGSLTFSVS